MQSADLNKSYSVDSDKIRARLHRCVMCVIFGGVSKLWLVYHSLKPDQHGQPRWTAKLVLGTQICQLSKNSTQVSNKCSFQILKIGVSRTGDSVCDWLNTNCFLMVTSQNILFHLKHGCRSGGNDATIPSA